MVHPYLAGTPRPRVLAHRGLVPSEQSAFVENSFAAVAAAHAAGAVYVESDCHLTRDGVAVLFHDDNLSRVTGDPRLVRDVTSRELAELLDDRGGLITMEQALDTFPTIRFNIDVKAEGAAVPVGRIAAEHPERVLLTSFSERRRRDALAAAHRHRPNQRPATAPGVALVARVVAAAALGAAPLLRSLLRDIDALQVPERERGVPVATPRFVAAAHRAGTEVHVWTVNDPADMLRLVEIGVDGIVTDRADLAIANLHPRG